MQASEPLPMKVVGRQGKAKVNLVAADSFLQMVNELRRGRPFIPKGVHRFKSFEEANEWSLKMMTRPSNRGSQL